MRFVNCTRQFGRTQFYESFVQRYGKGENSFTGRSGCIVIITREPSGRFKRTGEPKAVFDPQKAGNESLMRDAPVALRYWNDPEQSWDVCRRQSSTRHGAQEAIDACEASGGSCHTD
ncbi:ADP-ribosylglycohydrolase family protein [Methylobacterium komagatae]